MFKDKSLLNLWYIFYVSLIILHVMLSIYVIVYFCLTFLFSCVKVGRLGSKTKRATSTALPFSINNITVTTPKFRVLEYQHVFVISYPSQQHQKHQNVHLRFLVVTISPLSSFSTHLNMHDATSQEFSKEPWWFSITTDDYHRLTKTDVTSICAIRFNMISITNCFYWTRKKSQTILDQLGLPSK